MTLSAYAVRYLMEQKNFQVCSNFCKLTKFFGITQYLFPGSFSRMYYRLKILKTTKKRTKQNKHTNKTSFSNAWLQINGPLFFPDTGLIL